MSEFKFACPVCGQHIKCDTTKGGARMDCPTCFQKIIVPHAAENGSSKLILTAAQVSSRPLPQAAAPGDVSANATRSSRNVSLALIALILLACAAGGALFVFRGKIFKPGTQAVASETNRPGAPSTPVVTTPLPPADDTNWTLNLAGVAIPDAPVAGRISGRSFQLQRATVQGGTLTFRQGSKWPPEVGFTILLFAKAGEELAGRSINIETNRERSPKVMLRWKDDQQQPVTQNLHEGYALRLEFGAVAGNRLPGKIYFCAPDPEKSWVAGTFEAEIRKPQPPKPRPPGALKPKR